MRSRSGCPEWGDGTVSAAWIWPICIGTHNNVNLKNTCRPTADLPCCVCGYWAPGGRCSTCTSVPSATNDVAGVAYVSLQHRIRQFRDRINTCPVPSSLHGSALPFPRCLQLFRTQGLLGRHVVWVLLAMEGRRDGQDIAQRQHVSRYYCCHVDRRWMRVVRVVRVVR